ncbi:MAG: hypothetical protein K0U16_06955 [Gammaproteobacteria bacterium]|nr:hypothetical protein [Gammaproteobacteria bacterium]
MGSRQENRSIPHPLDRHRIHTTTGSPHPEHHRRQTPSFRQRSCILQRRDSGSSQLPVA